MYITNSQGDERGGERHLVQVTNARGDGTADRAAIEGDWPGSATKRTGPPILQESRLLVCRGCLGRIAYTNRFLRLLTRRRRFLESSFRLFFTIALCSVSNLKQIGTALKRSSSLQA